MEHPFVCAPGLHSTPEGVQEQGMYSGGSTISQTEIVHAL